MQNQDSLYDRLEQLLFKGFLTLRSSVNGVPIVFKSLNTIEGELIDMLIPLHTPLHKQVEVYQSYVMAYSTFLFNQVNILPNREDYIEDMAETFRSLPFRARYRIFLRLKALNEESRELLERVEPYAYGPISRHRWHSCKSNPLTDPKLTGIPGTDILGLNMHQQMWVYFNQKDDEAEEFDRHWNLTKFAASVHASKDIQSLNQKDRAKASDEAERRKRVHRSGDVNDGLFEGQEIHIGRNSAEDLMAEFRKDMAGQKDYHDRVIAEHEARVKAAHERKKREQEERMRRAREEREALLGQSSKDSLIFYDEDQAQRISEEQRQKRRKNLESGLYAKHLNFAQDDAHLSKWGPQDSVFDEYYQRHSDDLDPNKE